MPPTLKDIAQCCGTSVSTVSHVLNDRPGTFIGEATRRRVLDAADELGYRPNELARNLRRQRSMTIGVLAADLGYETHVRKVRAILAAAAERGYTTAVSLAGRGGKAGADAMGKFLSARVEGVIVASFTFSLQAGDLEEAKTLGVPVVAIDPPDGGVLAVRADREASNSAARDSSSSAALRGATTSRPSVTRASGGRTRSAAWSAGPSGSCAGGRGGTTRP